MFTTKKQFFTGFCEKFIASDADVDQRGRVGLNHAIDSQLVMDPAHLSAVGSKERPLSLS